MEIELAAKRLAELGHPTRLAVFQRLVKAGRRGLPVGEIQQSIAVPASTLSHHLSRLVGAGLVEQRRQGRTLYCTAKYDALDELILFLMKECCADEAHPRLPLAEPAPIETKNEHRPKGV